MFSKREFELIEASLGYMESNLKEMIVSNETWEVVTELSRLKERVQELKHSKRVMVNL